MAGVACDTCGAKLRVEVTGGNFYVREGSTLDQLNFEKAEDTHIITTLDEPAQGEFDENTFLSVNVFCSDDSSHAVFAHTISKVKCEVFARIVVSAKDFIRKHYS